MLMAFAEGVGNTLNYSLPALVKKPSILLSAQKIAINSDHEPTPLRSQNYSM
jgi:hypothetical protein